MHDCDCLGERPPIRIPPREPSLSQEQPNVDQKTSPAIDPSRAVSPRSTPLVVSGNTAALNLTLAVCDYEHVRDLTSGVVRADGIVLTPLVFPSIEEITFRFTRR